MKNFIILPVIFFSFGLFQLGTNEAKLVQQRQDIDITLLQCYVCENCLDNDVEQYDMALCGGAAIPSGNGAEATVPPPSIPVTVNGITKAPQLSVEDGDNEEEYGDYDEDSEERKLVRTIQSTTVKTVAQASAAPLVQVVTSTGKAAIDVIGNMENKAPEEDLSSYEYEYESDETFVTNFKITTSATINTTLTTTTTKTTVTVSPNIAADKTPDAIFENYEYDDEDDENIADSDSELDRHRRARIKRQAIEDPQVCFRIQLNNNKTSITNRGCATLIRGNKSLTCQSLSKGLIIEKCDICDTNGCNSYSNQLQVTTAKPSSAHQGLKANFWITIFAAAVLCVAVYIGA